MTRQEANKEILKLLSKAVEEQSDVRFGQLLRNMEVIREIRIDGVPEYWANEFYAEPQYILKRMTKL